jgi:hypothetical protein
LTLVFQLFAGVVLIGLALMGRNQLSLLVRRGLLLGRPAPAPKQLRRVAHLALTHQHSIEVVRFRETEFVLVLNGANCALLQALAVKDDAIAQESK